MKILIISLFLALIYSCGVQSRTYRITDCEISLNTDDSSSFLEVCDNKDVLYNMILSVKFTVEYLNGESGVQFNNIEPGMDGITDSIQSFSLLINNKPVNFVELNCASRSFIFTDSSNRVFNYFGLVESVESLRKSINKKERDFIGVRIKNEFLFL